MNVKSSTKPLPKKSTALLTGLFISTLALMTTGCASPTPPSLVKPPQIPANLTQPCLPLTPLEGKTGADVLRKLVEVGQQYNDCADSKTALINAVK